MNLIIVESPTKARTLSRFLGKGFVVEATMGHIKDLPKSKLSVDVEKDFKPDYQIVKKRSKEISNLRSEAKKAKQIFLATDPDREGEAIAKHVEEILTENGKWSTDNIKRIVFHEITKSAVEEAMAHTGKVDKNLVDAQIARRVLDRLVGYKLSPLLWKKVRRGLSAGRVQTVAVRLIVEREREIEAFKPEEYWEIFVDVQSRKPDSKDLPFTVKLIKIDGKKADIGDGKTAKSVVESLKVSDYKVHDIVRKEVKKSPYPPFTTSTMTQAAANLFGWSSKKTMSEAQKLYEKGLITYHRTDSTNIAKAAISATRSFIQKEYTDKYLPEKPRFFKTRSKSAQEAHEAIRPTDVKVQRLEGQKTGGEKLYRLIWSRFVACQMANVVYDSTRIDVLARKSNDSSQNHLLRATGRVMKFDGWKKVSPSKEADQQDLPVLEKEDPLQLIKVDSQQKFTQPPPRYNEASLIKTLEKLGIGRPSTYAPTISTIQLRNYVEKEDRRFFPTSIGFAVTDFMVNNFPGVFDYGFTADMEDNLDKVAEGEKKWQGMMKEFYTPFEKKLDSVEKNAKRVAIPTESLGKKCPTCAKEGRKGGKQGELVIRTGRFGKFISCSKFPECKHTEKYLEKLGDMKCLECGKGDVVVKKTRTGRTFYGCSRYPKCKWASWKSPKADDTKSEKSERDTDEKAKG